MPQLPLTFVTIETITQFILAMAPMVFRRVAIDLTHVCVLLLPELTPSVISLPIDYPRPSKVK